MRTLLITTIITVALALGASAQQLNTSFAALGINVDPNTLLGQGPTNAGVFTDSNISINIQGFPETPVLLLHGPLQTNALITTFGFRLDLTNQGNNYANQILVDGYANPSPATWTASAIVNGGKLFFVGAVPACTRNAQNQLVCITQPSFTRAVQAITQDPTNAPFNVRSTAAASLNFTNGYTSFNVNTQVAADSSVQYNFLGGFTFNFYGTTYSSCFISANGFVSFGGSDTGFPDPNVSNIRQGVRRIMSFYNDLEPEISTFTPRIYAQMFVENGARRVKIVHERLAEFGNATGPHGGEITMFENGDIFIFVPGYNAAPSINTGVGLTPGNNVDSGSPVQPGQTAFGRDLTNDVSTGPVFLAANKAAFELFDHGAFAPTPVLNPFDLSGFGFNVADPNSSGIHFLRDPGTSPGAAYIIQ
jgi:hypothetical protein